MIEDGHWRTRSKRDGTPFKTFREFVEAPLTSGLETTHEKLEHMCQFDAEAMGMLKAAIDPAAKQGAPEGNKNAASDREENKRDNIPFESGRGTSALHALARLKRDNPDLADKVVKGELSANAAAIQAGFRRPKIQIPTDDPAT